ncbi:MAG: hypothetical protein JWM82_1098 [Myxococcales bacterium]|nr:hypothetical protein [Myxococcales bacterium]
MKTSTLFCPRKKPSRLLVIRAVIAAAVFFLGGMTAWALISSQGDLQIVSDVEGTAVASIGGHVVQATLTNLVQSGQNAAAFASASAQGDALFQTGFNAADGGGANVGAGLRFTRMPRADLSGTGQWANHQPARATGPNAMACTGCHNQAGDDGGGEASDNVHRDGTHAGRLNKMIERNTPHLFGLGGVQRLAEEMTVDVQGLRDGARAALGCGSTTTAGTATSALVSKGVSFGSVTITHASGTTTCTEKLSPPVSGGALALSSDLIVRPFQWKGSVGFIRAFVRDAANNEIGMQAVELLGSPTVDPAKVDGDGDGVANELFIGDITALTVYQAAQPRPTTRQELASLGLIPALTSRETSDIAAGSALFNQVGCASCHVRQLVANDVLFREPSATVAFRDPGDRFPNGRSYGSVSLNVSTPIAFDLTKDQPENSDVKAANGQPLGAFTRDAQGHAVVALFGDLRRHDLGSGLAEEIDEVGTGASVFLTENLWGVGSTPPYLHDGRAATITEAILEHGGEGQAARNAFVALTTSQKEQLVVFLKNQVLFKTH